MNILLAVDNSPHSQVAVDVLLNRAWRPGTCIKVFCVVEPVFAIMKREEAKLFDSISLEAAQAFADGIADQLEEKFSHCQSQGEAVLGDSKELILRQIDEWPADLVVVGSRGRQGLPSFFLGSVSQTVLIYGKCSTLIARGKPAKSAQEDGRQNVLVAMDDTVQSRIAFDWVVNSSWHEDTQLKLLMVLPPIVEKFSDGIAALQTSNYSAQRLERRDIAQRFLDRNAKVLSNKVGVENVAVELVEGDPGEAILAFAGSWPAGLVVMGSRPHGQVGRLFLGSVSQEVVLQAPCPVEVVKNSLAG